VHVPTDVPDPRPARAPPLRFEGGSQRDSGDETGVDLCG
jgi:hypothetical protein